jgi:hypothetical protein
MHIQTFDKTDYPPKFGRIAPLRCGRIAPLRCGRFTCIFSQSQGCDSGQSHPCDAGESHPCDAGESHPCDAGEYHPRYSPLQDNWRQVPPRLRDFKPSTIQLLNIIYLYLEPYNISVRVVL